MNALNLPICPDERRRVYNAAWQRRNRERRREAGVCAWCPAPRGRTSLCEPCRVRSVSYARARARGER